MDIAN